MENLVTPVGRVKDYLLSCSEIHFDCSSVSSFGGDISFEELENALQNGAHYLDIVIQFIHDTRHISIKREFTPFSEKKTFDDIRAKMQPYGPAGLKRVNSSIPNKGMIYRFRSPISYFFPLKRDLPVKCAVLKRSGKHHVFIYQGSCSGHTSKGKSNSQGVRIPG